LSRTSPRKPTAVDDRLSQHRRTCFDRPPRARESSTRQDSNKNLLRSACLAQKSIKHRVIHKSAQTRLIHSVPRLDIPPSVNPNSISCRCRQHLSLIDPLPPKASSLGHASDGYQKTLQQPIDASNNGRFEPVNHTFSLALPFALARSQWTKATSVRSSTTLMYST
jgi:hypothetical protein